MVVALVSAMLSAVASADHDDFLYSPLPPRPSHDPGGNAWLMPLNSTLENHGVRRATVEAGERLVCNGSSYGHTVWYAFDLPARGQIVATVRGVSLWDNLPLDTIISLQGTGSIGQPAIACDDDGTGQVGGGSRLDVTLAAGRYYLQVGTYDYGPTNTLRPDVFFRDVGSFAIDLRYSRDLDLDDDGYAAGQDCNDQNRAVHPNAVDIEFNGIDEDCRGGDDRDSDNDGFNRGPDCNDRKRSVNPGVREVPGNFVDENCDGKKPAALLSPFPAVVFPSLSYSDRTVVAKLEVKDIRKGYRVRILCKGRGCPWKTHKRRLRSRKSTRIGAFSGRALRPGAIVEIYVTKPKTNTIGKYVRFEVRSGKAPKRVDCRVSARTGGPVGCKAS